MDTNKQESYILPECCDECVEADGFLGAKGCSNRECECHKESREGVEEFMECDTCRAKPGSPYLCRGCLHNRTLINKLTPLVAQKEQKEGVDYSMGMSALRCCDNGDLDEPHGCLKMPPTPTVKEESHTQEEWADRFDERFVIACGGKGSPDDIQAFIKEIASQEYQRGALYNHEGTFTRGFEAGRLQGIADAVAVVPNRCTEIGDQINASEGAFTPTAADIASEESWNNCRQAMLTALRSLTSKRLNHE